MTGVSRGSRTLEFLIVGVPRCLLGTLIFAGIAINFANVVGRYLFSSPIVWAEEILTYIMIWCVFIGAVLVTWEGRHIKMDLLAARVPPPWRQLVNALATLTFALVCMFVIAQSWTVVSLMMETGQQSVIARLPMGLMHASILVGFCAMLLALLLRLRANVNGEFGSDAEATARQVLDIHGGLEARDRTPENG